MGDLISRQAVLDIIHKEIDKTISFEAHEAQINIELAVEELPTVYDVDKVVEQLNCDDCETCSLIDYCNGSKSDELLEGVVRIIKAGGVDG